MNLRQLRTRVQLYVRDQLGKRYSVTALNSLLEEAIDRTRQYSVFENMPNLEELVEASYLPSKYHYLLAVYASSRVYELDSDYYQAAQRRNEYEQGMQDLITKIESGEIVVTDINGTVIKNKVNAIDAVQDVYFTTTTSDDETGILDE